MQYIDDDEFRLVACRRDGTPSEPICHLPRAIAEAATATSRLYDRLGYRLPWVGYIATLDGHAVGGGAFVGPPVGNRVEIAYFTLPERQRKGIAGQTAQSLLSIARDHSPQIEIFAKTVPEHNASVRVLERLGFKRIGTVTDHEVGEAWAWLLP